MRPTSTVRFDVDEQRGTVRDAIRQRPAQGGSPARPLQFLDQALFLSRPEQVVRAVEGAGRSAGQGLHGDDPAGVEIDDRLVDGAHPAGEQQRPARRTRDRRTDFRGRDHGSPSAGAGDDEGPET